MDIDHANRISMAEILVKIGRHPTHTAAHKLRYLSPLRVEKTASFHLDTKTNRWHDFGEGIGGDTVNFVRAYLKSCKEDNTTSDALRWIRNMVGGSYPIAPIQIEAAIQRDPSLILRSVRPIQQVGLIHYLNRRCIPLTVARQHLKEIHVKNKNTNKSFIALGFLNEEGGFELRNPFFKGSLGHKAISFIRGRDPKPDSINLFEGCMDFLSAIAVLPGHQFSGDTIILNSVSCLRQAIPYMHNYGYRTAHTWLDNDLAGEKATAALAEFCQTQPGLQHQPMNARYAPHKDVNAWHMQQHNLTA